MIWCLFVAVIFCFAAQELNAATSSGKSSVSESKSEISFTFCDDFTANPKESLFIMVTSTRPVNSKTDFIVPIDPNNIKDKYELEETIPQGEIQHVKVFSAYLQGNAQFCLKQLVIDNSVFVNQPTVFKANCREDDELGMNLRCKPFHSPLPPLKDPIPSSGKTDSSSSSNSTVAFKFCDEFEPNLEHPLYIYVKPKQSVSDQANFWVAVDLNNLQEKYHLKESIPQKEIEYVMVRSSHSNAHFCLQVLAVDINVFVDLPTNFKSSCSKEEESQVLPACKRLGSSLPPLKVCPNKISELLLKDGAILFIPPAESDNRPYELPIYHIANDMSQATIAMVEGIAEGTRKGLKGHLANLRDSKNLKKTLKFQKVGNTLTSIASFLGAFGPVLSVASGITSILTNFLTPNPFDAMVTYLQQEFDAVHNHLDRMEGELKALVKVEGAMTRMAATIRDIRYSLREYNQMMIALSANPVCNTEELVRDYSVDRFMENYKIRDTEHKLLDLLEVEEGGLLLTPSILKPFMSAYCKSDPGLVKRFIQGVWSYALLGVQAQLAYTELKCTRDKLRNCNSNSTMRGTNSTWQEELYKLLSKAHGLKVAVDDPAQGLFLFFKDDLRRELRREVNEDEPNTADDKMKRVNNLFIHFLNDAQNWPKRCILDYYDNTVVTVVVKSNAPIDANPKDGFGEYLLKQDSDLELVNFTVKPSSSGVKEKTLPFGSGLPYKEGSYTISEKQLVCNTDGTEGFNFCLGLADFQWPPDNIHKETGYKLLEKDPKDKIIYLEMNPENEYIGVKVTPADIFFTKSESVNLDHLKLGCWAGISNGRHFQCDIPQPYPEHPNFKHRYFALVPNYLDSLEDDEISRRIIKAKHKANRGYQREHSLKRLKMAKPDDF